MTSYASAAESLTNALHLSWPPIAVCLADSVPDGIPHYTGSKLPAGCVFWQEASKGVSPLQPTTTISALSGCTRTILRPVRSEDTDRRMPSRCSPSWATSAQTKYPAFQF